MNENPYQSPFANENQSGSYNRAGTKRRVVVLASVFIAWSLIALLPAFKVGSIQGSNSLIIEVWGSTLAGPFAFFEQNIFFQNPIVIGLVALLLMSLIVVDPYFGRLWSAVVTIIGVSIWFIIGLAITFVGV